MSAPSDATTPAPAARSWPLSHAIEILRIGTGIVWLINLVFIVDPANRYWSSFSTTARSFAPTTVGGPGLADYVSAHPLFFSWAIALVTGYLAFSLILGLTTRLACFVGGFFSAMLLATQFGSTFLFPGGTDIGAHPLYILIYGVLVVGGGGTSYSVDRWMRAHLPAQPIRRLVRAPSHVPWSAAASTNTVLAYFVAAIVVSLGIGFGLVVALPASSGPAPPAAGTQPVAYLNLSIVLNATNGWPQYVPANFSVPVGLVVFTITDHDSPMNWSGCPCSVRGTVTGTETVNGSTVGMVPSSNVAHTFNIPDLGVQVLSPGGSVVQFEVDFTHAASYAWMCMAPCGAGANPYTTPPMGTPGYMTGTLTVG